MPSISQFQNTYPYIVAYILRVRVGTANVVTTNVQNDSLRAESASQRRPQPFAQRQNHQN